MVIPHSPALGQPNTNPGRCFFGVGVPLSSGANQILGLDQFPQVQRTNQTVGVDQNSPETQNELKPEKKSRPPVRCSGSIRRAHGQHGDVLLHHLPHFGRGWPAVPGEAGEEIPPVFVLLFFLLFFRQCVCVCVCVKIGAPRTPYARRGKQTHYKCWLLGKLSTREVVEGYFKTSLGESIDYYLAYCISPG